MRDVGKTKEQLIDELLKTRQHLSKLEASDAERKQAEEIPSAAEEDYQGLFELLPIGVTMLDMKGVILYCNSAVYNKGGYTEGEFTGKHFSKIASVRVKDIPKYIRVFNSIVRGKIPQPFEAIYQHKDGTTGWTELIIGLIKVGGKRRILVTQHDITERKQAEEELRNTREFLDRILSGIPESVMVMTPDYKIVDVNTCFIDFYGVGREEAIGATCYEITHGFSQPCSELDYTCPLQMVVDTKSPSEVEHIHKSRSGKDIIVEVNILPILTPTGEIEYIVEVQRDITERKQAKEALTKELNATTTVLNNMLRGDVDDAETEKRVLDACLTATDSVYGMIGVVNEQGKYDVTTYSSRTIEDCAFPEALTWEMSTGMTIRGIWGWPILHSEPLICNDLQSYSDRVGFPKGHVLLHCFLGVPLKRDGKIVGMVAVANKPSGYTQVDNNTLTRLATVISVSHKHRLAMVGANGTREELEQLVAERTKQLQEDITERKQAEERLREAEAKYKGLVTNVKLGIFRSTPGRTGRFLEVNPAMEEITGYSREELLKINVSDLYVHPEKREAVLEEIVSATGKAARELHFRKKDGTEIVVSDTKVAVKDDNGKVIYFDGIIEDITERKQMEKEHQKIEKLESIGTLAGGIAHDFNNILTVIMGNISLARRHVEPKSKTEERLLEAEKASLRAKDLTQQLLTFARGGVPVKKTVAMAELLEEAATFALRGSSVKCEFYFLDDLWPVEVDEGQMNQVITNLVINADEAMPGGGILEIGAKNSVVKGRGALPLPKGNYVEITIKDHGIGISEDHLSKVFDPYFTTKQKGSGLGLATTYSIINSHDGYVTVESKLGFGTTFYIYLPASRKPIPTKREESAVQSALRGRGRILIMDDEEMIRKMLGSMLSTAGYNVELTSNGEDAIERYAKARESGQPFDVVIMDLTIPGGMGGKETIKKLLEIDPEVVAIVSSGYSTDPVISKFRKYGFSAVVTKPYSAGELERTLQRLMIRSRRRAEK